MSIQDLLNKLIDKRDLTSSEARHVMEKMIAGELMPVQIAAILTALRIKSESVDEIETFIRVLRENMLKVEVEGLVIDTAGTGGDGMGTFNISTASALVAAAAGVKVAKHGNRNASSFCGSADVLESLGVNISLTPDQVKESLNKFNFAFLFAPLFHPALKHVAAIRKEMGIRTVFNFLGPFLNPCNVKRQIIGVPTLALASKLATVAQKLEYEHLFIVTGSDGMDEISLSCPTDIFDIKGKRIRRFKLRPEDFGLKTKRGKLRGGCVKENVEIIKEILAGRQSKEAETVILNVGAALFLAGRAKNFREAGQTAREILQNGYARGVLEQIIKF